MVRLNQKSPPKLEEVGSPRSGSLRGAHKDKLPDISSAPLNTLLPAMDDEAPHPQPYYITQGVVLKVPDGRPPWQEVTKQSERRCLEFWDSSGKFRQRYLEELLKDCLYGEITGICSGFLVAASASVKKDRALLSWLQEEVIEPVVFDQSELSVYEELWDSARMLSDREREALDKKMGDDSVDETFLTFLKDHHRQPLTLDEGKSVYGHKWGEVLYHLNKIISRASLMENYAIRRLQEQFITQIAAQVLFEEGVKYMEEEMREMDEKERVENPPRKIVM